ncbi:hypothetical protein [Pseudomonas fluorescens]|uniref:hypothetical protein n=1 Tax=Pseudomonas fluorescens TaxID=294 RepID=UPI0007D0B52A|nr:hypothetical protein [Pseudomonas fluorescens]
MSINVNSTQISTLLQLYPMAIPGALENLQPPGAYHLGIPESIYSPSTKLFMVIDPVTLFSTSFAAGDSVRLWVNKQATSVIKTIKPGEENVRIFMELPWGGLKDGLNTLYYEVTRVSGNKDKSNPILNVLFNNPVSGITVSHPASIGPEQTGPITITISYPRPYGTVTLTIGTWSIPFTNFDHTKSIIYHLTAAELQQIGSGTHPVSARVIDQLTNSNVSATTSISITANQKVYNPPIIVEAEPGKVLDVASLAGKNATLHARTWSGMVDGQPCWLKLLGFKANGSAHDLQIWNGLPARTNPTWISQGKYVQTVLNSYLAQLGNGRTLTVQFWVSEDKSNNFATATKFVDQVYTVKASNVTITSFKDSAGASVPNGGRTFQTGGTLTGTAGSNQQVQILLNGTARQTVTASATGIWNYSISGLAVFFHTFIARPLPVGAPDSTQWRVNIESEWKNDYTDFQNDSYNGWLLHNAARSGYIRIHAGVKAFFNFTDEGSNKGFAGTVMYKDFDCLPGTYSFRMQACHVADSPAPGIPNPILQLQCGIAGGNGAVRELPKTGIWYDFLLNINVPARRIVRFYIQNHQDNGHGNDFGIRNISVVRNDGGGGIMESLEEAPLYSGPPLLPLPLV